jgi:pimeloyl-ACP methyl ester carboxylesterase
VPPRADIDPGRSSTAELAGCAIHYRTWGDPGLPPVVLVHGMGAHSGWWSAVAAPLEQQLRLIALDLSGNGDSARRAEYTPELWVQEILALIDHETDGHAALIGHSRGGRLSVRAAAARPAAVSQLVLLDAPIRRPDPEGAPPRRVMAPRGGDRVHPTLEEAVPSFHLQPHEPVMAIELFLQAARESFRQDPDGWRLKADPAAYVPLDAVEQAGCLAAITCPATVVRGELSMAVQPEDIAFFQDTYAGPSTPITIRGARHHLIFDQASQVAEVIRTALRTPVNPPPG